MKIAWKLFGVVFLSLVLGVILWMMGYHKLVGDYGWAAFYTLCGMLLFALVLVLCHCIGDDIKKEFDDIRREIRCIKGDNKYQDAVINILRSRIDNMDDGLDEIREKMQAGEESMDAEEKPAEDDAE